MMPCGRHCPNDRIWTMIPCGRHCPDDGRMDDDAVRKATPERQSTEDDVV